MDLTTWYLCAIEHSTPNGSHGYESQKRQLYKVLYARCGCKKKKSVFIQCSEMFLSLRCQVSVPSHFQPHQNGEDHALARLPIAFA